MAASRVPIIRISAWAVTLPLRAVFATAATKLGERDLILVKVNTADAVGWGEAAPVPGHTRGSFEEVWDSLETGAVAALAAADNGVDGVAGAALDQARTDAAARAAGLPLSRYLGATAPVWASAAIGLRADGSPDEDAIRAAAGAGYRHAKLKISPDTSPADIATVIAAYKTIEFGLDANGSLGTKPMKYFSDIDELGVRYLEQPGSPEDLDWHRNLRNIISTPLALDESAATAEDVESIIRLGAADIVNIKPGRLGTTLSRDLARTAGRAGLECRVGGLVESGIGRAHAVALAGCYEFSVVGDIAASDRYFTNDLVSPQWRLHGGRLVPTRAPGIGVEVDEQMIEDLSTSSFVAE